MSEPVTPSAPAPASPAQPPAAIAASVAAPVSPAPATESAVSVSPTPASVPAATGPSPEANPTDKPASGEVAPAADITVLGAEVPKVDVKPAEVKPTDKAPEAKAPDGVEPKKEEGSQSEQPAQLPTYEEFKLPEGIPFDKELFGDFTKTLGEFQVKTKADQALVQELGQKLVDRHVAEVQSNIAKLNEYYQTEISKQKNAWKEALIKDPEIGGNRIDTTTKAALAAVREGVSMSADPKVREAQTTEFRQFMETGIGNHPALVRTFANLNKIISDLRTKYESESGVKSLPGTKPEMPKGKGYEQRYGKSK